MFHPKSMTYWFSNPPVKVRPACSFFPAMFFCTLYSSDIMWLVLALSQHASVSDNGMAWGTGYSSRRPVNGEARDHSCPEDSQMQTGAESQHWRPGSDRWGFQAWRQIAAQAWSEVTGWSLISRERRRTAVAMEMLEMQHTFEVVLVANGNFFGSQCILMIHI